MIAVSPGLVLADPPHARRSTPAASQQTMTWQPQIAIVWPHDGQGAATSVEESRAINVSVWPADQVRCSTEARFQLMVARQNGIARVAAVAGEPVTRSVGAVTFPALEYNDIEANLAGDRTVQYRLLTYGAVEPTRQDFAGNVWIHAADPRTILPGPVLPLGLAHSPRPAGGYDARIQVVWPHDGKGNHTPVEEATYVNVAVDVFAHDTFDAVIPDATGSYPFRLTLLKADGNGALEPVLRTAEVITQTANAIDYARWVFNDVPVNPAHATHFVVSLLPVGERAASPYTTVWTHASDARTILPNPPVPPSCVP
ncbi:MAG TPA: hypothetical protein GX714_01605 [Chloroflexi bacterium]|nr:hypothetical protein [Chloroflexota bacterium]